MPGVVVRKQGPLAFQRGVIGSKMSNLIRGIRGEFYNIKRALEEHLTAINENTSEIQALFDYLQEMDIKVEKLSQRLDQLQISQGLEVPKPTVLPLNHTEKKVFLALYTEEIPLTYREIAERAKLPLSLVPECISSLTGKGIALSRNFCNGQLFIKINPEFKELQAKEKLINLSLESFM